MKIVVVGTINKDLILPYKQDTPIESFGGIFYDISVLSYLLKTSDKIVPVSYLGGDISAEFIEILHRFPNVSTDGLILTNEKNHQVTLEYSSPNHRTEISRFPFPSLNWEQISPHVADADIIILNLVSGWDISLSALKYLSEARRERLYMDIHYLTMGRDSTGKRFLQMPTQVAEWLSAAKFVQMNEDEYTLLAKNCIDESDFYQRCFKKDQVLLLTKSVAGVQIFYQVQSCYSSKHLPAYAVSKVVDATGCGDSFGAGFAAKYLETSDVLSAAAYGNLTAAAKITLRGTTEMHKLKQVMNLLAEDSN